MSSFAWMRGGVEGFRKSLPKLPSSRRLVRYFSSSNTSAFVDRMTVEEALLILNISQRDFTKESINSNHRVLMRANHPDNGGTTYLAMKINEAKTLLLEEEKRLADAKQAAEARAAAEAEMAARSKQEAEKEGA
eukprot:gnl/Hemi2/6131_TR2120_c0_g1_i1.p1 gnl/Hemi2/6131_TR2120_c0_g1~~gnl/Hemi2/6131_TR2120_c0_g1_i1.p1  ORF type:complete len:134 (+),score=24.79 gnl/Hemi2/6131_TR2120_c0_g1_i1:65-466(+)